MSFLRQFLHDKFGKSQGTKPPANGTPATENGPAPSPDGLINPFADSEQSDGGQKPGSRGLIDPFAEGERSNGARKPGSGGLIDPFAESKSAKAKAPAKNDHEEAAATDSDADTQAKAKKVFEEADKLYKKKSYAKAAKLYEEAYKLAGADQRGAIAFNIAQAHRLANNFAFAVVWYQKALTLGGATVTQYREEIEGRVAEMQAEMKKKPERGPEGEDFGEAKTLFQEADIAYAEKDYAKAVPLYKQAYERSGVPAILFNLAQACRLSGQYRDAKYWYREFLKKVPSTPYKAEVEQRIEEMKQKVPDPPDLESLDDAKSKFAQADALYKAGSFDKAGDLYVEVFYDPAASAARGPVAFNIAQCMRLTGNKASAVQWYKKALEFLPADSQYVAEIKEKVAELTGAKAPAP